jgi:hypothetical protein
MNLLMFRIPLWIVGVVFIAMSTQIVSLTYDLNRAADKLDKVNEMYTTAKNNNEVLVASISDQNTAIDKLKQLSALQQKELDARVLEANRLMDLNNKAVNTINNVKVDTTGEGSIKWLSEQSRSLSQW